MAPATASSDGIGGRALRGALLLVFALLLVRTAWLCDDAYLTLRTVDQFLHGNGLRWNAAERVQAYTHPLWMFALAAASAVTREMFLTPMLLGVAVSTAAAALLAFGVARTAAGGAIALLLLAFSRAWVDYATSGLENPLSHLLLFAFAAEFLREPRPRRLLRLSLLASLAATNRLDSALLFAPAMCVALLRDGAPWPRRILAVVIGALPLAAWEAFSLVYYGFLFPNTAYAKLGSGVPAFELARQGLFYCLNLLRNDPLSAVAVVFSVAAVAARQMRPLWPFAVGSLLHAVYVVKVGGDFMSGRFFTPCIAVAAVMVARTPAARGVAAFACAAAGIALLGLASPAPTIAIGRDYEMQGTFRKDSHGISDERSYYHRETCLPGWSREARGPRMDLRLQAAIAHFSPPMNYVTHASGIPAFAAGREAHMIDVFALGDPLLARLPAMENEHWRIGHFARMVPAGYRESLESGEPRFEDRALGEYWKALRVVTRDPIFSVARLRTIARFQLGRLDPLVDAERWRQPTDEMRWRADRELSIAFRIPASRFGDEVPDGTPTLLENQALCRWSGEGVRVLFDPPAVTQTLRVGAGANRAWRATFLRAGAEPRQVETPAIDGADEAIALREIAVPDDFASGGFDAVELHLIGGEGPTSVAYVVAVDQ